MTMPRQESSPSDEISSDPATDLEIRLLSDCFINRALRKADGNILGDRIIKVTFKNALQPSAIEVIRKQILSFNPCISHYRIEEAPRAFYLPGSLTIKSMYQNLIQKHLIEGLDYSLYQKQLQKMNIKFTSLGSDVCPSCFSYKQHRHTRINRNCIKCQEYTAHTNFYRQARFYYHIDRKKKQSSTDAYLTADLQKFLLLPVLANHTQIAARTKRLICFNQTFVPLGRATMAVPNVCILWHEGEAGRGDSEIASAFIEGLKSYNGIEHITLWLDNHAGQNKNWTLYNAMAHIINTNIVSLKKLTLKYLTPSHTFMTANPVHAAIERKIRISSNLEVFQDLENIISKSGRNTHVRSLKYTNFYKWEKRPPIDERTANSDHLTTARVIQFVRGESKIYWKTDFTAEKFHCSEFLLKHRGARARKGILGAVLTQPRGINLVKREEIITKLGYLMRKRSFKFWTNISAKIGIVNLAVADDD
ncbi:uncharacterized protein TRIADDRAFT_56782 [Trichoplax adhaerens]|uniref:Uncharacterized protein n=1 Tax=Trichoplax adhaerens TaxID=10228 RepID=B3RWK5_TRIAD|nr:predicted protein [Trichoplax adhaerens]EDV25153.1 predicted protein [Trichoplax adhaerens]|eukprot:XP_002113043.1 predicted protein [Trichoplax adhaerens]